MRILIVTHWFPPEIGAGQARLSGLAAAWASDGEDVTVLTGVPNHPTGVVPAEYRRLIRRRERRDGYQVVRTWLYATPNEGVLRRTLSHLSFMFSSVLLGTRACGPADIVIGSSPTFFSLWAAWALAKLKRARLIIEVRDLWPAIFSELGVLTNRPLIRLLERSEMALYRAADAIVVVTDGFRASLTARGVPASKIHTIYNGADLDAFDPAAQPDAAVRTRLGARPGDCLVLYAGTHGIAQGLPVYADTALMLRDEAIHLAFVGEGADKARLGKRVADLNAWNVSMLPSVPPRQMPALLAAADICLVALRDVPLFSMFIPSKLFEYLAAGRAVIGAVAGEAAEILRAAGAVVIPPEDSAALAAAIRELAADPRRRQAMSEQGRSYVVQYFDRIALAGHYRKIIRELVETPGGGRGQPNPAPVVHSSS